MNLTELKTFLAIIETGSLVGASQYLNVTQSTVTARLKTLEQELGLPLINRLKSGATLTPAGVRLERYARTISDLWQQARQETSLPAGLNAVCNIACEHDLWSGLADRFFSFLRTNQPQIALYIWLGSQAEVSDWMARGATDMSFTYAAFCGPQEVQIELRTDRLILVSTDPDASTRFNPNYVFVEAGDTFGRAHAASYADADITRLSFNSAATALAHILEHGGSAYLPYRCVATHLNDGGLYQLEPAPVFERRVFINVNRATRSTWTWFDDGICAIEGGRTPHQTGFT